MLVTGLKGFGKLFNSVNISGTIDILCNNKSLTFPLIRIFPSPLILIISPSIEDNDQVSLGFLS